jgi:hypothetical protein
MLSSLDSWLHGWSGIALAYGAVQAPMMVGLLRERATATRMLLSPLAVLPVSAVSGVTMALMAPLLSGLGAARSAAQFVLGTAVSVGLGYASGRALARADRPQRPVRHQRGALVLPHAHGGAVSVSGARRAPAPEAHLTLAGVPLTPSDEVKHFKLIGTTGTGKSTAIAELLRGALSRGDRAVIADPDGGYLRRFHDEGRGDVILNPFEPRSVKWDPFAELRAPYDVDQLARSLIPDHEGTDRSWPAYARTFFTAVTQQAHAAGVHDIGELYRLLVVADTAELRELTRGTPAQPFLDEHNTRMFDSIRSVTSSAVAALDYIAAQRAPRFSVRDWLSQRNAAHRGVLFIPYRAGQLAALRAAISAWMRIAIFEAMERPEADQRLWFVVDELDAIGQIDGLKDALARLRKFGGRCVLGFQSIAQVATTYGAGDAHTIVENCGNALILRCSASEGGGTARFASTLIGQREVTRVSVSSSRRLTELIGSTTRSEYLSIEPAVLDSQIEQLPDLAGYLKIASRPEWRCVRLSGPAPRIDRCGPSADREPSDPHRGMARGIEEHQL